MPDRTPRPVSMRSPSQARCTARILYHSVIILAAAGLGLAMGYILRGRTIGTAAPLERLPGNVRPIPEGKSQPLRAGGNLTWARAHDDSPLATQLERDLSMSSGVTRWLYWLEGVEKARVSDFPRLARLAHGDAAATRLLAARWMELDLPHLFHTLSTVQDRRGFPVDALAEILFEEWPRRDPDAAVNALSGTNTFGTHDTWRLNVAGLLVETDPARGLRVLSAWGIDNYIPSMSGVNRWAAADPRGAAEVALANPAGHASRAALAVIGREWSKSDPARALEFATAHPGELGTALAESVLRNWAGQNIRDAAQWLSTANGATRNLLSPAFVEAWAKSDPGSALAWCESNLAGAGLARAVGGALQGTAQRDVTTAVRYVDAMRPSPARAEAAAAVATQWFPGSLSGKPVPQATIAWLRSLDSDSAKRALAQVQWRWSIGDPRSMAEFLANSGNDRVPAGADSTLARSLARQDPAEALAWAHKLPAERGLAAGRVAFAEWRRWQPESAMGWLQALPSSDQRRSSFARVAGP